MTSVSSTEAMTHLSALLQRVGEGETITITRHSKPMAKLVPVDESDLLAWVKANRIEPKEPRPRVERAPKPPRVPKPVNNYKPIRWASIAVGDRVRLRPKRVAGDRVEVTVARVLDRTLLDGRGFVDEAGGEYREWYYDIEVFKPPTV